MENDMSGERVFWQAGTNSISRLFHINAISAP